MLMYTGAASSGFRYLEEVILSVSPTGLWILGGVFCIIIVAALFSEKWWPSLAKKISGTHAIGFDWLTAPYSGGIMLLLLFFFLFPLSAFWAHNSNAWWLFLLFGWGMDFAIIYFVVAVKSASEYQQKKFRNRQKRVY